MEIILKPAAVFSDHESLMRSTKKLRIPNKPMIRRQSDRSAITKCRNKLARQRSVLMNVPLSSRNKMVICGCSVPV